MAGAVDGHNTAPAPASSAWCEWKAREPAAAAAGVGPAPGDGRRGGLLQRLHAAVSSALYRFFLGLGCLVADRPAATMACCLLLTGLCCTGFARLREESRPEYLYTPQNAESFAHRAFYEENFPYGSHNMQVYVIPAAGTDGVLSQPALQALLELHAELVDTEVEHNGETWGFADLCDKVEAGRCFNTSILQEWGFDSAAIAGDANILQTVNSMDRAEAELLMATVITAARGLLVTYIIAFGTADEEPTGERVDKATATAVLMAMHETLNRFPKNVIAASAQSQAYLDQEANRALDGDMVNMVLGYAALNTFTSVSFLRRNAAHNLTFSGMLSMMSIAMALASAYGTAILLGVPFSQAVAILPFILVGLGVDDAFVIVGEMRNVDPHLEMPVRKRISRSLARSGVAILATSFTDFFAFVSGVGSAVPAIRHASVYAAFGAFFDFFYQVTFFVAGLVYKGRANEKRICFPLPCIKMSDAAMETRMCSGGKKYDPDAPLPLEFFARRVLAPAVLHPIGKAVVLLVGVALTAVAAWQVPDVYTDFNYEWFAPSDSPLQAAFEVRDNVFEGPVGAAMIVTKQADIMAPERQRQLLSLVREARESDFVRTYFSWFEDFHADVLEPAKAVGGADALLQDPVAFYTAVCQYDLSRKTRAGISWGVNGARLASCLDRNLADAAALIADPPILASKALELYTIEDGTADTQTSNMEKAKAFAGEALSEFDAFAYHYSFLIYESYPVFRVEILKNVSIACACVFAVTLVMLANVASAIQVFLCVIAVDTWLVGFMGMVGLTYNAVTCINIVFAVGIAVDYTMHITHAFLHAHGTRQERAREALHTMGPSVMNGALSTLIGVMATAGSSAYVFRVFFLMMMATTMGAAFFGLAFVPALLSLVGSGISGGGGSAVTGGAASGGTGASPTHGDIPPGADEATKKSTAAAAADEAGDAGLIAAAAS
eukprot:jgi/Tetstr1/440046/TSEL_028405.t1